MLKTEFKEQRSRTAWSTVSTIRLEQVRWIDQIPYPISLVASLDTVPVLCCVPLFWKIFAEKAEDTAKKS